MKPQTLFALLLIMGMSAAISVFAASDGASNAKPASSLQQGGPQQGVVLGQPPAQYPAKNTEDVQQPAKQESSTAASAAPEVKPDDAQALFQESLRQMMPLNQEQIREYRERSDQRERALLPVAPSLGSKTVRVTLEPGHAPAVVHCTANIATSLVFHDTTGQPWPITSVTNGGPQAFQILRPELPEGNLLNVMPIQPYGSANIVVTLAKQDIPLVIRLESDSVRSPQRNADGLVLFQLAHFGPNAQSPLTKEVKETASSTMIAFLDHVPPSGATRVSCIPTDDNTILWKLAGKHYLRTTHSLMWPAWISVVNGAGGIKCYELPVTPRIMLSRNGVVETFKIRESAQ